MIRLVVIKNTTTYIKEDDLANELTREKFLEVVNTGRWLVTRVGKGIRVNGFVIGVPFDQVRINERDEIRFDHQRNSSFGVPLTDVIRIVQDDMAIKVIGTVVEKQKLGRKERRKTGQEYREVSREVPLVEMIKAA